MVSLEPKIKGWIAESESWQAFIDFKIPREEETDYPFLKRWDDFYISLMSNAFDIISKDDFTNEKRNLLSIAKSLAIYSLEGKRDHFNGINIDDNLLYSAALYYLAGYSASSHLLARMIRVSKIKRPIDIFIMNFLKRDVIHNKQQPTNWLHKYLATGDSRYINYILNYIHNSRNNAFEDNYELYSSFTLAYALIKEFSIDNIWVDLKSINSTPKYWNEFVNSYLLKKSSIWSFFPSQRKAISNGATNNDTCSFQMPTSAGKTAISELIIYNSWKQNPHCRILYLAPFRSLAAELKITIGRNLQKLGINVKTIYGGNVPTIEERDNVETASVLISTPEKLLAVEDVVPNFLRNFDIIICDEGHLLDDNLRGLSYELLLSRFKSFKNENTKFVFISAIVPNINEINKWLGGNDQTVVSSTFRPTELEYAFLLKRTNVNIYDLQVNPLMTQPDKYTLYRFLVSNELSYITYTPRKGARKASLITSKKGITVACSLKVMNAGSVAVFCPEKRGAFGVEDLAEEVVKQLKLREDLQSPIVWADSTHVYNLAKYFEIVFGSNYLLSIIVKMGFLYHHADLPQFIREIIENSLRENKIKLVLCTNTLAEGVNLPIRTIVIHSTTRFNGSSIRSSISIRDLKNLVGRAGRAGKETRGMILIPHKEDFETIRKVINEQEIEAVYGSLLSVVRQITNVITTKKFDLTNDILEGQSEAFLQLLDSIDIALIDLVSETISTEIIEEIIQQLIRETLCYHLSNKTEKNTLSSLLSLRSKRIIPFLSDNTFKSLKNSGTSFRNYSDIISKFDFNNEIWLNVNETLSDEWINYILHDGIFKLKAFHTRFTDFNEFNKTDLTTKMLVEIITSWMLGDWYSEIAEKFDIKIHNVLRAVNAFISYDLQSLISSVIKIKTLLYSEYSPPSIVTNWPQYLQYGISTDLELAIIELGLVDRVAVLFLSSSLLNEKFEYSSDSDLKIYLIHNSKVIISASIDVLPVISYKNVINFLKNLD